MLMATILPSTISSCQVSHCRWPGINLWTSFETPDWAAAGHAFNYMEEYRIIHQKLQKGRSPVVLHAHVNGRRRHVPVHAFIELGTGDLTLYELKKLGLE